MIFAWSVLYDMSLCLFCFFVLSLESLLDTPIWESQKLCYACSYASLKFLEPWICSSTSLISFWARCALLVFKKFSLAWLRLLWEIKIMLMIFTYICLSLTKATYENSPKVIDIQGRYNKIFRETLDKRNLILSNGFEIWRYDMWVICDSLIFGPFFFFCFSKVFAWVFFFRGFMVWKLKKMTSSLLPEWLVIPKSFPRPYHFHPSPNLNIFYWEYSFSIKGITQIALGCEATYISITPKITK